MRLLAAACLLVTLGCQNRPPSVPIVNGTGRCRPGEKAEFTVISVDADGDLVDYEITWGDGVGTGWSGPWPSGIEFPADHVFADSGRYAVVARCRDGKDESEWSDSLLVLVRDYGPFVPHRPSGPDTVTLADSAWFVTVASHPLDEPVSVEFDWGDSTTAKTALGGSGSQFWEAHQFVSAGSYEVRARAIDTLDHHSAWSEPETVLVVDTLF